MKPVRHYFDVLQARFCFCLNSCVERYICYFRLKRKCQRTGVKIALSKVEAVMPPMKLPKYVVPISVFGTAIGAYLLLRLLNTCTLSKTR